MSDKLTEDLFEVAYLRGVIAMVRRAASTRKLSRSDTLAVIGLITMARLGPFYEGGDKEDQSHDG